MSVLKLLLTIIVCIILCSSCLDKGHEVSSLTLNDKERQFIYNEDIGTALSIIYDQNHYLISDINPPNGKYFKVLDSNFEIVREFGERGESPWQIDGIPRYMAPSPFFEQGKFFFIGGKNLYKFSYSESLDDIEVAQYLYPKDYHFIPQQYLVVDDSLLWINGGSIENRFFVFNLASKEIVKEIPHLPEFNDLDMYQKIYGFNAHGVYDAFNKQVIWVYNSLNLIEIYDPFGELKKTISFSLPLRDVTYDDPGNSLFTFQNVIAFKNGFICFLYDRDMMVAYEEHMRNRTDGEPEMRIDFKWLVVFDVDGNEKGRIKTPSFTYFTVNPNDELLVFTSTEKEDYPIYTLPLPDLIREIL